MATLNELRKYINYEFSTGCTTGEDYKQFQTKYINYLKTLCKGQGWELVKANKNHYEFSAFIKHGEKYIYLSISDVRFFPNEWYKHILIRTAKNEKDYTGGCNNYTSLDILEFSIKMMFERM